MLILVVVWINVVGDYDYGLAAENMRAAAN
jgi:hypothetical protein